MLILSYESDAERKRIDYAIERWRTKLRISKPKGTVIILDSNEEEFNKFIEDLFSRIELEPDKKPESKVEIYRIEKIIPEVEKRKKILCYEADENVETIWKFLNYLMAKINASYEYSIESAKIYTAYTKKDKQELRSRLKKERELKLQL